MRDYELMVVLHPDLDDAAVEATVERLRARINADGTVNDIDDWGRRRLAYDVRKVAQGTYFLLKYTGPAASVNGLKQFMAIDLGEAVIRYLIVRDEHRDEDEPEAEAEPVREQPERRRPTADTAPAAEDGDGDGDGGDEEE